MPKAAVSYVRYFESFITRMGKAVAWAVFLLIAILLYETIARYVFNVPTVWSLELGLFTLGTYYLIGGGWILLRGGHVRMDALYNRWSAKRRAVFDLSTFSLFAVYLIVFIWGGVRSAAWSLNFGQISESMWGPPLGPIKIIITIGASLLFLQGVAFFIRDLSIVKGKPIE